MKIKYLYYPDLDPDQKDACYILAYSLAHKHPQGLEPAIHHKTSPASGRHFTTLTWHDVAIRIFYVGRIGAAMAISFSRTGDYLVSQRQLIYRGTGNIIDPIDVEMLFSPSRYEPPFR